MFIKWRVQKQRSESLKAVVAAFPDYFKLRHRRLACLGCSGGQVQTPAAEFAKSHGAIKCTDSDGARLLSEVLHSQHHTGSGVLELQTKLRDVLRRRPVLGPSPS